MEFCLAQQWQSLALLVSSFSVVLEAIMYIGLSGLPR